MKRDPVYYVLVLGLYFSKTNCEENITEKLYNYSTEIELSNNFSALWLKGILSVTKWANTSALKFVNLEPSFICEGFCYSNALENSSRKYFPTHLLFNLSFLLINDSKKQLLFSENETVWSRNIKRGIASFIDVDYGSLPLKPLNDGKFTSTMQESKNSFQIENIYHVQIFKDNGVRLLAAESIGKYMEFGSQEHQLRTKQKIEFISEKNVKKPDHLHKMIKHEMDFEFAHYGSRFADFETLAQDPSHLINLVRKSFNELTGYLEDKSFHFNASNQQRSKSLRLILTLIKRIDLNGLRQLHADLETKEERLIFFSLLSHIGTDASVLFMCQFYLNQISESELYYKYLMEIPFHFRNSTEKSLRAWLTCHKSAIDSERNPNERYRIDRAFYLAFGVVFNKFYKYQLENLTEYTIQEKSFFLKFIRSLFAVFEMSETKEQQLETLDFLKNALIGSPLLLNYLNETVLHNKTLAIEVRLSVCLLPARTVNFKYSEQVFLVYSSVLMNEDEPLVMRAAALDVIIQHPQGALYLLQPSFVNNLKSSSSHLSSYLHLHMKQLSRSGNPHDDKLKVQIADRKLLNASTETSSTSFVNKFTYFLPDENRGRELLINYFAESTTCLPNFLHVQFNSLDLQDVKNDYSIYIVLNGVTKYFLANVLKKINSTIPLEEIPQLLSSFDKSKMEGSMEIVVEKYGYVLKRVSHKFASENNEGTRKSLTDKVLELLSVGYGEHEMLCDSVLKGTGKLDNCKWNSIRKSLGYLYHEEKVFTTDTGFTFMHSYFLPYYYQFIRNESAVGKEKNLNFFSRLWLAKESELSVYNPFLNSLTGVTRLQSTLLQIPFSVEGLKITKDQARAIFLNKNDSLKHFMLEMKTDVYHFTEEFGLKNICRNGLVSRNNSSDNLESVQITATNEKFEPSLQISKIEQDCATFSQTLNITASNWTISRALFEIVDFYLGRSVPGTCNLKFMSIPSESSTKISVDVRVNGSYTDKHPLSGKQFSIQGNVSLIGEALDQLRSYTFNTNFTSSSNDVSTNINTKLTYYAGGRQDGDDYLITFSKQFPPLGEDAFAYGWGDETVRTRMEIGCAAGHAHGCMRISFDIEGQISEEQKAVAKSARYPYERCRQEQNERAWQGAHLLPRTWACYESAIRLFYTRKVTLNAKYTNVPKNLEDLAKMSFNFLNSYLSNYLNSSVMLENTKYGNIKLAILHNATTPKLDMNLSTPIGSFHYKDVPGIDKDIYNIQLDNTHFSKAIQFFESTALVRSCIANAETVLTPDNSTVEHTFNSSYDLLTSTFDRKFAVLAKKSTNGMAVKVLIGNLSLEITSSNTSLNGNRIENLENGFEFPKGEPNYIFRIWKNREQVTVYSKVLMFYLIHSPVSITLDLPVIYLGQVVGLCGNLDYN